MGKPGKLNPPTRMLNPAPVAPKRKPVLVDDVLAAGHRNTVRRLGRAHRALITRNTVEPGQRITVHPSANEDRAAWAPHRQRLSDARLGGLVRTAAASTAFSSACLAFDRHTVYHSIRLQPNQRDALADWFG